MQCFQFQPLIGLSSKHCSEISQQIGPLQAKMNGVSVQGRLKPCGSIEMDKAGRKAEQSSWNEYSAGRDAEGAFRAAEEAQEARLAARLRMYLPALLSFAGDENTEGAFKVLPLGVTLCKRQDTCLSPKHPELQAVSLMTCTSHTGCATAFPGVSL